MSINYIEKATNDQIQEFCNNLEENTLWVEDRLDNFSEQTSGFVEGMIDRYHRTEEFTSGQLPYIAGAWHALLKSERNVIGNSRRVRR